MRNPNIAVVYSPEGEPFETSKANARDLVEHAGWSFTQPTVIEKIVEVPAAPVQTPAPPAPPAADENDDDENHDDDAGDKLRTTVEDFADLTERDDVVAYLAKHFPDFQPHHRAGRDSLVEKAVELATAEAGE